MIKTSLNNILTVSPVFKELVTKNFSLGVSFKIARLIRELDKELNTFKEVNSTLIDKYCEKDDKGETVFTEDGMIKIKEEFIDTYNEEIAKMISQEVEIQADKLEEKLFDDIEYEITPATSLALLSFIE